MSSEFSEKGYSTFYSHTLINLPKPFIHGYSGYESSYEGNYGSTFLPSSICFNILVNPASVCSLHFYCKTVAVALHYGLQSFCKAFAVTLQNVCNDFAVASC